ncbi:hypothetical protein V8E52_003097 [Russula decolorans]
MSKSHCPFKKSGVKIRSTSGRPTVRYNFACDLFATMNAKGSSQQAQPVQARNSAIGFVRPSVMIFNLRDENWFLLPIKNHHKYNKLYGIMWRGFIRGSLRGKEEALRLVHLGGEGHDPGACFSSDILYILVTLPGACSTIAFLVLVHFDPPGIELCAGAEYPTYKPKKRVWIGCKPRYGISPERALVNWVYCVGEPPAGYQIFSHRPWLEHHHTPLGSRHRIERVFEFVANLLAYAEKTVAVAGGGDIEDVPWNAWGTAHDERVG